MVPSIAAAQTTEEDIGYWIFDAGAGVPKLSSNKLRLSGELTFGYGMEHFAISATGGGGFYDFESDAFLSDNAEAHASLEGWYLTGGPQNLFRFELRASAGYAYYDGKVVDLESSFGETFLDKNTSNLVRGTLLVGGRLLAGPLYVRILAGGGAQFELYEQVIVDSGISKNETQRWTFRAEGRALVRWRFWPTYLSLRLKVHAERFDITRTDLNVRLESAGSTNVTGVSVHTAQLEVRNRLSIDVDVLEFGGFVPAIFAGLEVYAVSSDVASPTSLIPVFGIELARPNEL